MFGELLAIPCRSVRASAIRGSYANTCDESFVGCQMGVTACASRCSTDTCTSRAEKRTIALRLIRLPVLSQYYTPITALGLLSLQRLRSCLCIRLTGKQSRLVFTVTNITVLCSKNVRYEEEYLNG
jgi:hypothetical protein